MVIIRSRRLVLRELKEADVHTVNEYSSDLEVVRFMDWGPNTKEDDLAFIQRAIASRRQRPRADYTLAIVLKKENRLIGSCAIHVSNLKNRDGWIGYCLNRCCWNRGYATEAARALLKFGFGQLRLHRIFATCDPANVASAHVLKKAGMKREGHLREFKCIRGEWKDSLVYAMLEQEWNSRDRRKAN